MATIIAEPYPSTATPGRILDKTTTATAVRSNFIISFILKILALEFLQALSKYNKKTVPQWERSFTN